MSLNVKKATNKILDLHQNVFTSSLTHNPPPLPPSCVVISTVVFAVSFKLTNKQMQIKNTNLLGGQNKCIGRKAFSTDLHCAAHPQPRQLWCFCSSISRLSNSASSLCKHAILERGFLLLVVNDTP